MEKVECKKKKIWTSDEYNVYVDCILFYEVFSTILDEEENLRNDPETLKIVLRCLALRFDISSYSYEKVKNEKLKYLLAYSRILAENIYTFLNCFYENPDCQKYFDESMEIIKNYCEIYKEDVVVWKKERDNYIKRVKRIGAVLMSLLVGEVIYFAGKPFFQETIEKIQKYIEFNNEDQTYDFNDIEEKLGVLIPGEEENLKRERTL